MSTQDTLSMLIRNIIDTDYDALPADLVEATKKQILDTLGAIIIGSTAPKMTELVDLVKDWGGKEESTIVAYGGRVPSPNAALINGTLAVVCDYDDFHEADKLHASRATVPASFAMSERKGAVNGKDFITAVALGFDLAARLSRAVQVNVSLIGWELSSTFNFFGAAASAGKILGFDAERMKNALGLAYQQTSGGEGTLLTEGSSSKGLLSGLAAKGGIIAALIAAKDFTSPSDYLEGRSGFYNTFYRGLHNPALLTTDLGSVFEGVTNSQKPYPCARSLHTSIDATLALVNEYSIKPDDVAEVTVNIGAFLYSLCEPLEVRQNPKNPVQAQFSVPWVVANAILNRKVGIEHFTPQALQNQRTIDMAQRVTPKLNCEFKGKSLVEPAIIEIKTRQGEIISKRTDFALGSPQNPMSFADIVEKFKYCCSHAVKLLPQKNIAEVVQMVEKLETVTDVCQIIRMLG